MPPLANVLAFVVASAALIAIPGPSVLFVIGRSLALGRRGGLISVLGNTLGMLPLVGLVAVGVGAIVAQSVLVFTIIKLLGAGYLVYLGVQTIRHRRVGALETAADGPARSSDGAENPDAAAAAVAAASAIAAAATSTRRLLAEAFVVGVTNPKTIVFFVAALPQFVDLDAGAVPLQMLVLGAVFAALALCMDSTWALAAGTARGWFARSPRRIEHLRGGGGVMMIGLGGVLALSGNRS